MNDIKTLKTHCKRGHEISPENTYTNKVGNWSNNKEIKIRKVCKICLRAADARAREKRKLKVSNV